MTTKSMEATSEKLLDIIHNSGTNPKTGEPLCTPEIACPKCGEKREAEKQINAAGDLEDAPDPCLGILPGVVGACCGHGIKQGCIAFDDGTLIYGYLRNRQIETASFGFDTVNNSVRGSYTPGNYRSKA